MNRIVTVSISEHITENFKSCRVPFYKLADLVKSKFNYTAGLFKDGINNKGKKVQGYRNKDNYLNYSDVIILDVDDGITINQAKQIFEPFSYIIATTKSHQKEKNGIICDRFRVILPTDKPIELDKDEYSFMMEEVYKDFPFVDTVCKDASRFYYPSSDSQIIQHEGFTYFYWEDYHERAKGNKQDLEDIKRRKQQLKEAFGNKQDLEYGNGEKIDYIRNILGTERLLKLLKYDEKYVSGQRNKTLYSYGKYFIDLGFDNEETKDIILWINNQGDSIPEDEVYRTVFKSLRLN